ncbi:MAG: cation:proton antiporter [Raoultibacter sp.]
MPIDLISLAVIALVAALSPMIAQLIPGKPIPETVFLLIAGAVFGPFLLGFIQITDSVTLLSDLGLAFLFLLAGYEINPKHLTGSQGKRGLATWVITLGLAFLAVRLSPNFSVSHMDGIAVAIALTTTALGTLLPILKERNLINTRVGESILAYGTYGELCPVIAMALLLSSRAEWLTILILVGFVGIAVLAAAFSAKAKKAGGKIFKFLTANANTTAQTAMRVTVLLLVALVALSAVFDLDIVLGAFAAGFVLRYVIPEGDHNLETKLDGIAYGFLIPLFFVTSGAKIDLAAVFMQPALLIGFILMLLLIRAVPIVIALTTGKDTRDMSPNSRITVALYCTTALPVIVAVTSIAVKMEAMPQETASVLVSAGAITVFLMPLLASITYRVVDAQPLAAVKEISRNPREIGGILRDHLALERMLAKQDISLKMGSFSRAHAADRLAHHHPSAPMDAWLSKAHVDRATALINSEEINPELWEAVKAQGDFEWTTAKAKGDKNWSQLKEEGDKQWSAVKKVGDEALEAQDSSDWQDKAAALQSRAALRNAVDETRDEIARRAAAARAVHIDRVAHMFAAEQARRIAEWGHNTEHNRSSHTSSQEPSEGNDSTKPN